jgi:hypothetical protein
VDSFRSTLLQAVAQDVPGLVRQMALSRSTHQSNIEEAGLTAWQLLEDVQASIHDSTVGEAFL